MELGFGLLAECESRADIEILARDLCERVAQASLVVRGTEYALTLSVGIALAPARADTGDPDRWLWGPNIGYIQDDALASGGPRLDYEFSQLGL